MKQLLILSGKGGTGKTTVASSFIRLSQTKQFADCDVEAPNLHLTQSFGQPTSKPYYGLDVAMINQDKCVGCGRCLDHCRFHAITNNGKFQIDPYKCEGCHVCEIVCPQDAIDFHQNMSGSVDLYDEEKRFSTGQLKMGSGNSGLLVTEVKRQLVNKVDLTIIDGPPGIGCPVIASMSGVDMVLVVTEPSLSGFSDMQRMVQTIQKARIPCAVCINKYDMNRDIAQRIQTYLVNQNISYVGKMAYSRDVSEWINRGIPVVLGDGKVSQQLKEIYHNVMNLIVKE